MISQENSKKEPLAAAVVTTVPKLIRVVAPTNLPGGYQMEVQTDNDPPITFTATVPMEGVKAGDVFLTPPPMGYSPPTPQIEAPIGRWRDGLFDCFSSGPPCTPFFLMSLCFNEIALGQLMQRFNLTWVGGLTPHYLRVVTYRTVVILYVCYRVYDYSLAVYLAENVQLDQDQQSTTWMVVKFMRDIVALTFSVWSIYAMCKTRQHVRKTYSIPEQNCIGCEDCLVSTFFPWCAVCQMGRHTADPEVYPTFCCTETGLSSGAPAVV